MMKGYADNTLWRYGYRDGRQFHQEFNFQPYWDEQDMLDYWRGWRQGKDDMIEEVNKR